MTHATISPGPLGLTRIETDGGTVYVNRNGYFNVYGAKIHESEAIAVLGIDPRLVPTPDTIRETPQE